MYAQRVAESALKGFFKITEHWGLTESAQRMLLGEPPESIFSEWKTNKSAIKLDEETLLRISCVLGIYKVLVTMHSEENQRLFLRNSAENPPFNNMSPLDLMLRGLTGLAAVNRYLHVQHQAPCN